MPQDQEETKRAELIADLAAMPASENDHERREKPTAVEEEVKVVEVVPEPIPVSQEILSKWKAKAAMIRAQLKITLK